MDTGCFHILAIVNAMNIEVHYLFELVFSSLLDIYSGVELLGLMVVLFLVFSETTMLFSTVAAPIYIPTNNVQGISFLYVLTNICYSWYFWR